MTWAYDAAFTANSDFDTYFDSDSKKMYESIVECVKSEILTKNIIAGVIPSGTTMQNIRTSYMEKVLTADGYHASTIFGCYALSLTWLATMTDLDVESVTWIPESNTQWGATYDEAIREVAKEAVINAVKSPYEVTTSTYIERPDFSKN